MQLFKGVLFLFFLCYTTFEAAANPNILFNQKMEGKQCIVHAIHFSGNKITRDFIMLREMNIRKGDTVLFENVAAILEFNKTRLLNMQLFSIVDITPVFLSANDSLFDIQIAVKEVLYWLPKPIFSLADRNFNVWWVEQQHDFSRTNIGFELNRVNFRGRDEKLNVLVQMGYNKLFNLAYRVPYVNKAMTIGMNAGITYATGREIFYATQNNKLLFYTSNNYPYQYVQCRIGASYRGEYATVHDLLFTGNRSSISNELYTLNSNYFGGRKSMQWFELQYAWHYNQTDARVYPTQGKEWKGKLLLRELNTTRPSLQFQYATEGNWYYKLNHKWSMAHHAKARLSFASLPVPYYFNRAMGFKASYIRGYEYYVIDGSHYVQSRNALRYQLVNKVLNQHLVPLMTYIPLRIYVKAYNDMGWVYDLPNSRQPLNNRLLIGYGIGVDIFISYYARMRIEYSLNHLGENGLFLHALKE